MSKRVTIEPQLSLGLAIAFAQGRVDVLIQIGDRLCSDEMIMSFSN